MTEDKYPWTSKIELTAFVALIATLGASFGLFELSEEQVTGIGALGFTLIMVFRYFWTNKNLVMSK